MIDLEMMVAQIDSLAPMPQAVTHVMALADDPHSSLADVADVIKYDPVITANMLKICNSAYFGLPRAIDSIHDATMLLGLDQIVELFILRCAFENLDHAPKGYDLREHELVEQSVASALVAKIIASTLGKPNKHLLFTAALLKDIGKVVLSRYISDFYEPINELVRTQKLSFIAAEKKVLGLNHADIGGLIAKRWGFSSELCEIITNHHLTDPATRDNQDTAIVYLSDQICMQMGLCAGLDGMAYPFYDAILERLHLSDATVNAVMVTYLKDQPKVEALMGVDE